MIKGKWKLLISIALVTCVIFMASNGVFAAINLNYYEEHVKDYTVADSSLDSLLLSDILVDALGKLIFNVGRLLEYVLGQFFKLLTGSDIFPWADAILFNAVPFLDINVFAPSGTSLLATIQDFVAGTYYTVLMLASAFFGVAVMVTAIKLVLTTIAEDKAKYKKAIIDWILGLVMLWGIHFFISLVLYLNEELVKVASQMVSAAVQDAGEHIVKLADSSENNTTLVLNFSELMIHGTFTIRDFLQIAGIVIGIIVAAVLIITGIGAIVTGAGALASVPLVFSATGTIAAKFAALASLLKLIGAGTIVVAKIGGAVAVVTLSAVDAINLAPDLLSLSKDVMTAYKQEIKKLPPDEEIAKNLLTGKWEYEYTDEQGKTQTRSGKLVDVAAGLLKNSTYREYRFPGGIIEDGSFFQWNDTADVKYLRYLYLDTLMVCGKEFALTENADISNDLTETQLKNRSDVGVIVPIDLYRATYTALSMVPVAERNDENFDKEVYQYSKALCDVQDMYVKKEVSRTNVVTNLAMYFKQTAYTTSASGWVANKSVIQNALLYAILVVQSLIFFISYTKRLFYVIMLILMAPIVVVFDFFTKFGK